jgi:hypothetical protein
MDWMTLRCSCTTILNTADVLAHIGGIELLLFLVEKGLATQALRI